MKKLLILLILTMVSLPCFAQVTGTVDYNKIISNYTKAQKAYSELDDQATELQRYLLDKEKEFKKLDTPLKRKAFEEQTAKAFAQKQEAFAKIKAKKEAEIDKDIQNAIKAIATENGIDSVVDYRVIFYGGVDITDKVIKKLNIK
ncbi:MAG: OmpH family outer membrane protein [Cyanobacteria bacterium SIG30]|nr:OmpH family outer membrane protein [Cyanobacteria bacterium SIG30]